ncbi:MAG: class I SAM-dependent methyltransferase [Phycisphaerales bacterium]
MPSHFFRYTARRAAYSSLFERVVNRLRPPTRLSEAHSAQVDAEHRGAHRAYIEATFGVQSRAALSAILTKFSRPESASMLDLGCGGGQQAEAARCAGFSRYLGVDLSSVAIETARERMASKPDEFPDSCAFETGSVGSWAPADDERFDVIVFSEVLYYLGTARDGADEVIRSAAWLREGGLLCVSLKDDGKSHAILRELAKGHEFVRSVVFQEQMGRPRHRVRLSQERPAYLIAAMRPRG